MLNPTNRNCSSTCSHDVHTCCSRQAIRAIAVSAPDCIKGTKSRKALNSPDPVSLFNACRCAANAALRADGAWGKSNWAQTGKELRNSFLLMYSLDDMHQFRDLLQAERPNIVFIGAMTLCMPGAIECAKLAREVLKNNALIVLGGRHANETIFLTEESQRLQSAVIHHTASPGRLIREGKIPPLFDVIISGEAELLIKQIGELVTQSPHHPTRYIANHLDRRVAGRWIIDFPHLGKTLVSAGIPLKHDELPSVVETFGITASFEVFRERMTSHVFSDTGPGCVYDCAFCSERRSVTGNIQEIKSAASRLYKQFKVTVDTVKQDHPYKKASAFVEDSIFLSGSPRAINQLCHLLEQNPLDIVFGGQFTIDQIINKMDIIERLAQNGLTYVFIGLETLEPDEIGGLSKDLGGKKDTWENRFIKVLNILKNNGISCGCALLFGLGEKRTSRKKLIQRLALFKKDIGQPILISANWAVRHPLRSDDETDSEDFLRWGTPEGELLEYFHSFGEASLEYPLPNVAPPTVNEVKEVHHLLKDFEAIRV
ncbi:B12-binding domain/radical SAM domain-containing protein [Pseudomonas sp. NPDC089407]|uniref:B12-binding domain/radical SAM domain-containing protein n=1 Tax=Pseudomonas sp. NPDC089407 TaxID=3364464 RepID=UPI00384B5B59